MKWLVTAVLMSAFFLAILLLSAGRWDWPAAYVCVVPEVTGWVWAGYLLQRDNPILFARRSHQLPGTPSWDYRLVGGLRWCFFLMLSVAGLDAGRQALPLAWPAVLLGSLLYWAGLRLFIASQRANPFFEGMVRYQSEFAHRVIEQGPYARLRHPGYAGFLLVFTATACMLGSKWAVLPLLALYVGFFIRIYREESFLCEHLPDYKNYQQRVAYRILPGIY